MPTPANPSLPTSGRTPPRWRRAVRRRFPALVSMADKVGDPVMTWAERRLPDAAFLRRQYAAHYGVPLDLERPRLFSEKIQWLKINDVTPLHRTCADKVAVRDHVASLVGAEYLVPLIDVLDDARALTPERVTAAQFAAKVNHDCGGNVLCRDRDAFDWEGARARLAWHLRRPYWRAQRELAYRGIVPRILVEQLLPGREGGPPDDYKLFCFGGRVEMIQVCVGRGGEEQTRTMYDRDWNRLPMMHRGYPVADTPLPAPPRLGDMIAVAEALSEPFSFCRVDLYAIEEAIYFGEYTFYPAGGYRPFDPEAWEEKFGDLIAL